MSNPTLVVVALILVSVLPLVVVTLLGMLKQKAGPATQENVKNLGKGLLIVIAGVGAWGYYEHKEREKKEQAELAERGRGFDKLVDEFRKEEKEREALKGLSLRVFDRLRTGMSYSEVSSILGRSGNLTASTSLDGVPTTEMYEWTAGKGVVTCLFQGDKLVIKSQAGLR